LGVPAGSSLDVVRRAWHAAALESHPDRGGDAGDFNRKRAAWAILRGLANQLPTPAAPDPTPWTRARAINRAVELDLYVEDFGDETGVTSPRGDIVWFTDAGALVEDDLWLWEDLDDQLMWSVFDLAGASRAAQD
jgi:hypothetical protein